MRTEGSQDDPEVRPNVAAATPTTAGWNFADVWETIAGRIPDEAALIHGPLRRTWAEWDARANRLAHFLHTAGLAHQDKVALYLYNGPEYLESVFAAFKAGLVPVNTNYRYGADEIVYLLRDADAVAVVFNDEFTDLVDSIRDRLSDVRVWLWVGGETTRCPDWAVPYEAIASTPSEQAAPGHRRSGDDLLLLYTGGTTGRPKGVMWRQDDLFVVLNEGAPRQRRLGESVDLDHVRRVVDSQGPINLPACPLMHGTGAFSAMTALSVGGAVVTLTSRTFQPDELLDTVDRERVNSLAIVGEVFAKPLVQCLEAHPGRWDLSSLRVIVSSGVMWREKTKRALLAHAHHVFLVDSLGSSEAVGMAQSVSSAASSTETARFTTGPDTCVVADDGTILSPGSPERGRVAKRGRMPVGYYKDPDKTASTFVIIGDERWSIPGDYATVDADGTITLLGRGSACINTGGEKVYAEEVEEAVKGFGGVADAAVVGVPDDRFGEAVAAVVEASGATVDAERLVAHVKRELASYKAPRHVIFVDTIGRSASGKVDYTGLRDMAISTLASRSSGIS